MLLLVVLMSLAAAVGVVVETVRAVQSMRPTAAADFVLAVAILWDSRPGPREAHWTMAFDSDCCPLWMMSNSDKACRP